MTEFRNNSADHRYELTINGTTAFIDYTLDGERIALTHTEVPAALGGQGVGSKLVKGALDDVRARNLKVVPHCSFVKGYIDRHPDYQDLVSPAA